MRARVTLGKGEHDVVFECDHTFRPGCAATLENPAEYDEHEFCGFVVLALGEWERTYPFSDDPRGEWFDLAGDMIQSMYDEFYCFGDELIEQLAEPEPWPQPEFSREDVLA